MHQSQEGPESCLDSGLRQGYAGTKPTPGTQAGRRLGTGSFKELKKGKDRTGELQGKEVRMALAQCNIKSLPFILPALSEAPCI